MVNDVVRLFVSMMTILAYSETNDAAVQLGGILCKLPKNAGWECDGNNSGNGAHSAFYFDADINECIEFVFAGCGGNANRFATKIDCEDGCGTIMKKCSHGEPLMDFAGNIKRCDGDRVPCPGSYECIDAGLMSVCCLKADRVCKLRVESGTVCGVAASTRYYFDSIANICRSFTFLGCGANENNFKTSGHCMQYCSDTVTCLKGEPLPDRYSMSRIASCYHDSDCPKNYSCTSQGERRVSVANRRQKAACCPSQAHICAQSIESNAQCEHNGANDKRQFMWTFKVKSGKCDAIAVDCIDNGGNGNERLLNLFASVEQCSDFCIGKCPTGFDAHLNPYTQLAQLCNPQRHSIDDEGCPFGYECTTSSAYAAICCRTYPTCPAAESLMLTILPNSNEPRRCSIDNDDCPTGYSCQRASNSEFICCTAPHTCPYGLRLLRESFGQSRICSPHVPGTCPSNYICMRDINSQQRHLCCKPELRCLNPYVDKQTNRTIKCYPDGGNKCPLTTNCVAIDDGDAQFYCCHHTHVDTCPDGRRALHRRMNGNNNDTLVRCNQSNPESCPNMYECSRLIDGTFACCQKNASDHQCTSAMIDRLTGESISCDTNEQCERGNCRRATDGRKYCCDN